MKVASDRVSVRAGRIVAALILLQILGGFLVNFKLEEPLFGLPGFLVNAAPHSQQIALAVVLALATEAFMLAIAILMFPIFRERAPALAIWFVAFATVGLAVAVVENVGVLSMVSVSQKYIQAGAVERAQLESVKVVVASARNWAHYLGRIIDGATLLVFYAALFQGRLVPRGLAGFGLAATILQMCAVATPLFGRDVNFALLAPLGVCQIILLVWLFTTGFRTPRPATE